MWIYKLLGNQGIHGYIIVIRVGIWASLGYSFSEAGQTVFATGLFGDGEMASLCKVRGLADVVSVLLAV